jgi:hypothetical protein
MSKGRKGRSPDQIRKDRTEIARLYLEGLTQAEIGLRLSLSRQQVGYDLESVRREWLKSSLMDFNVRKAQELAKIDHHERVCRAAWEESKQVREITTTEQVTGADGERVKAALRKENQTGDPRYLAGIQWCIEQRCKILGLNAPQRHQHGGDYDSPSIRIEVNPTAIIEAGRRLEAQLLAPLALPSPNGHTNGDSRDN